MNSPSDAASGGSGLTPEVSRRDGVTHSLGPCGVLGVVLVFLGVYLLTASGHLHTIDSYHVYNVTRSLVEQGDLTIPPSYMAVEGRDGRYYSKFGVGQSVLAVPIFGFAKALEGVLPAVVVHGMDQAQQQVRVRLGGQVAAPQYLSEWPRAPGDAFRATVVVLFFNPIVSALGLGLLLRLLLDLGVHRAAAVIAITALALGTFLWPLSRDFFQHPLEMTLLIAVLLLWVRGTGQLSPALAALMGAVNGLAVLTRVFTVVWVPLFLLALVVDLRSRRALTARLMLIPGSYLGPVLLACGVVLWLNDLRFGEFTKFGYHTSYDSGGSPRPYSHVPRASISTGRRSTELKRRFRTEATLKIARLDISVITLSRRLPSLVLAVAGLFVALAVVARVLVAPQWDWNAARLAFSFALAEGYDLYPVDGSDPLPGYMYGPVFAIAYLPAKLFSSPTVAVLAGASLAVGYVLVPAFVLMRRCEPARLYSWIGLVALAGTCLVSDPLRYSTFSIHADAPLLGLLTAASAMWYSGAASPQLRVSAALMVAAALWCKQNVAPVAIAFPLWSLLVSGPGAGLRALFVLGAVVLAASIVTISAFGLKGLMFNLVTIPSSAPWYGSGTALERLAPVGIDYLRLVGPWWLLLAALAIIHRTLAGVPRETWRQWAARSPWLLIALEGALLAPMCILAKVRVGGGVNSWTPALFLLVIACLMAMLALTRRSESSRLPGGVVSVARALALAWALGIGNYQLLEPGPAEFQRPEVRHPFTNPQQQAHDYLSANPGSAYFPWNPLAHLMAESRLVHYADGIITRAAAGFPISQAEFEAGVGRNFAFVASAPTRRNQWVQQHYLSVFSERVDLPGLPGWTVYQVPSPKHP